MLNVIIKETLRGKSLHRTLMNKWLERVTISGSGLDLGAKDGTSSYYEFLNVEKGAKIRFTDLQPKTSNVLSIDLEKQIPVENDSQDFLLLMNVLEHLFDYQTCINECYRVLKPNAKLIGAVPFLIRIHPDPDDYFRYTESSIKRILKLAGFEVITIVPLGYGPVTAGVTQFAPFLRAKLLIILFTIMGIGIDKLLHALLKKSPYNN